MLAVEVGADYVEQVFVQQALDLIFRDDISNVSGKVSGISRNSIEGVSSSGISRLSSSSCSFLQVAMTTSGTLGYFPTRWDVHTALRNPQDTCLRASATDSSKLPAPSSSPGRIWQWQSVPGSIMLQEISVEVQLFCQIKIIRGRLV